MPFRLSKQAADWFKDIRSDLGAAPMFDMYYFCLVVGLATNKLSQVSDSETAELVDSFPAEFAPQGRVIMALFISRELRRQGVRFSERAAVNESIGRLVDPNSPSRLSAEGLKIMNQYSNGGFEVLTTPEWFEDRPRKLETFLLLFHRHLKRVLDVRDGVAVSSP